MSMSIPSYPHDLFSDDALGDAYPHYANLRDLGPLVWLEAHQLYVLPRYDDVRAALGDAQTFCSGQGAGLNDVINGLTAGKNLLSTDGADHDQMRKLLARGMTPRALRTVSEQVEVLADELVGRLVAARTFDAVMDLARALPMTVVPDLVGWPEDGREHLLEWAGATFDMLGPLNERATAAVPRVQAMVRYAAHLSEDDVMAPGSMGSGLVEAAQRGEIPRDRVASLMIGYLAPSLDTTISALGSAVWLFATHPEQWQALRADPSLIPNAFNEVVRFESPLRAFSRVTTAPVQYGDTDLPEGARVVVHFASANRDDRHFADAGTFDITRENAGEHVGFGYGVHGCAGQGLARMEAHALLAALARQVEAFELRGAERARNNIINAFASLPVTVRVAN